MKLDRICILIKLMLALDLCSIDCFFIPIIEKIRNDILTLRTKNTSLYDMNEIKLIQARDKNDDEECQILEQAILTKLRNNSYSKHKLPSLRGVNVTIEIHIQDISALDEFNSEFDMDLMFSVMWTDPKLAFQERKKCKKSLTVEYSFFKKNLWSPNICISNTKNARIHESPANNVFAIVYHTGNVWTNYRMRVRGPCDLNFVEFPLDKQKCFLKLESYSFNSDDVKLLWLDNAPVTLMKNFTLPDFDFRHYSIDQSTHFYPNGEWSQLSLTLYFKRRFGFYFMQAYAPSYLTVVISWISFCIDYRSTPARTTIGISSLLAVTFQFGNVMKSLPKVGYVKALDVFMLGVTMFIFATLIELAIVCCLASATAKTSKQLEFSIRHTQSLMYEVSGKKFVMDSSVDDCMMTSFPMVFVDRQKGKTQSRQTVAIKHSESYVDMKSLLHQNYRFKNSRGFKYRIRPEMIDRVSMFVFPIAFVIFNVIYWTYYIRLSQEH